MEDYYQDKKQKRIDIMRGVLINLVVGVAVCCLYLLVIALLGAMDFELANKIIAGIVVAILVIAVLIIEFRLIRKQLKGRRYIAIGMIVALVLPLLAFGTCSQFLYDMTF